MPFGKYLSIVPALFINATNRQGKSPRPSLFPRCFTAYPGQVRQRPPSPLFVRSLFAAVKGLLSRPLAASLFACSMLQCLFFPCSRQLPHLVRPVFHLFADFLSPRKGDKGRPFSRASPSLRGSVGVQVGNFPTCGRGSFVWFYKARGGGSLLRLSPLLRRFGSLCSELSPSFRPGPPFYGVRKLGSDSRLWGGSTLKSIPSPTGQNDGSSRRPLCGFLSARCTQKAVRGLAILENRQDRFKVCG